MNKTLLSLALLAVLAIGCTTQPIETRGPCPWNMQGPDCEMQILSDTELDAELDAEQRQIERSLDAMHDDYNSIKLQEYYDEYFEEYFEDCSSYGC